MQVDDFLNVAGYQIHEGGKYCWNCYGDRAWQFDFKNDVSIVFDLDTKLIYEISVWSSELERSMIWVDPTYEVTLVREATERGYPIDYRCHVLSHKSMMTLVDQAFSGKTLDLDLANFIDIDLTEEEQEYLKMAAEREGVTIDEYVNKVLTEAVERHKAGKESLAD
jgi:hypothetical protein